MKNMGVFAIALIAVVAIGAGVFYLRRSDAPADGTMLSVFTMAGQKIEITFPSQSTCSRECSVAEENSGQLFANLCEQQGFKSYPGLCCDKVCTGDIHMAR